MKLRALVMSVLLVASLGTAMSVSAAQSGNQSPVSVTPNEASHTVDEGEAVTVSYDVDTDNASVYAYEVVLEYDTDTLDARNLTTRGFLASDGVRTLDVAASVNETAGLVHVARSRTGNESVAGQGPLFTVTFAGQRGTNGDAVDIDSTTLFLDKNGTEVNSTARETAITVVAPNSGGGGGGSTGGDSGSSDDDTPPAVDITVPEQGQVGTELSFNATVDGTDSDIESYQWTFDGDTQVTGKNVTRSFAEPGTHSVRLVAVDDNRHSVTESTNVTIVSSPSDREPTLTETTLGATDVRPGENVTVTATLANPSTTEASRTLELSANGTVVTSKTVTLGPNETVESTLSYAPAEAGTYDIAVNDTSAGTVSVTSQSTPTETASPTATTTDMQVESSGGSVVVLLVGAVLVVAAVGVVLVLRQ